MVRTKTEKTNSNEPFPDYVLYEGREIRCSAKWPNHAEYMMTGGYMNRVIILNKHEWQTHCSKKR